METLTISAWNIAGGFKDKIAIIKKYVLSTRSDIFIICETKTVHDLKFICEKELPDFVLLQAMPGGAFNENRVAIFCTSGIPAKKNATATNIGKLKHSWSVDLVDEIIDSIHGLSHSHGTDSEQHLAQTIS